MKNIVLQKVVKENVKKVFTKKKGKDIINKDYNLLSKDCNSIYEREGLYMRETKVILEKLKKQSNWKIRMFVKVFPKTCIKLYRKGMVDCFNYYNKHGTF